MKKHITALLAFFLILSASAQSSIETILNNNQWSSREDVKINLNDDQGNETFIPVSVIKGKKPGPTFTVVAGVHGFEYPPIVAAQELLQEINLQSLTGTLIIIPITNTAAFYERTMFVSPLDKVNLNRAFPGSKDGTVSQQIAHFISSEIIPNTDVFLDVHGGDANEDLLPFVCYYNNEQKPEQTSLAKKLSEVSGFEYIVSYPYTLKDTEPAMFAFKQAVQHGKTALSIESGKLGNVQDEAVSLIKKGVYNMLNEMGMYKGSTKIKTKKIRINQQAYIKATQKGVFYSTYRAGDSIKEGDIIGSIKDEFGNTLSKIIAPNTGVILYKIGTPPVNIDNTIMCIGYSS
ncbi:MAG: M14 family metallopeptidase [Cyclobacteriaceae bacterium]